MWHWWMAWQRAGASCSGDSDDTILTSTWSRCPKGASLAGSDTGACAVEHHRPFADCQPMANEDETVWTVFNGELYNHRTLRRDLEARGHRFRGHSDTEILPHLYEEEGPAFVHKLRGMFALAIYDTRSRTLLLVHDRFGIKPLFYAPGPYRLAFASEIPALLQFPDIDVRLDTQAIAEFTALSLFLPPPLRTGGYALCSRARCLKHTWRSIGLLGQHGFIINGPLRQICH